MTANSSVEFLIWLLIAASLIAVIAERIGIPYTVAAAGEVHYPFGLCQK